MARKNNAIIHPNQLAAEKMVKPENGEFPNPFAEMFWKVNNISEILRESVCKHCDWSIPTFYRKLRTKMRTDGDGKIRNVSVAEMASIKAIYVSIYEEALRLLKETSIEPPTKK